jgi:hypothetical protein
VYPGLQLAMTVLGVSIPTREGRWLVLPGWGDCGKDRSRGLSTLAGIEVSARSVQRGGGGRRGKMGWRT